MRKFYNSEKVAGEIAVRHLSEKALHLYENTDPMAVYEYEEYNEDTEETIHLYAIESELCERDGMSFKELEETLEELYDLVLAE